MHTLSNNRNNAIGPWYVNSNNGPSGFDFGDLLVTVGGDPAYTGIVSNGVTGAVLYFDNGFCKGTPQ